MDRSRELEFSDTHCVTFLVDHTYILFTFHPCARFENPVEPVTSGFLIEGHKYQYFESTSTLLDLYWVFESTSEHLRISRDNMW